MRLLPLLALLFAFGCTGSGTIGPSEPVVEDDDDTSGADDDDSSSQVDDDDSATDDDDVVNDDDVVVDDDDVVVNDDDVVMDDDDVVVDDDDVVVDDDDSATDDDDSAVTDDDDSAVVDDDDSAVVDDDDSAVGDDDDSVVVDDDDVVVDDDDSACADSDGDGICDDVDLCDGDDASGDTDGDGICDDIDTPDVCGLFELVCGETVEHSNDGWGSTDSTIDYDCIGNDSTGPEVTWIFEAPSDGEFTLELTGLSADLDLILMEGSDCDASDCESDWEPGNQDEELEFEADAGDEFRVRVDGWDNAISDFELTLLCPNPNDLDGDGVEPPLDCDDNDDDVYPGAPEECDAADNDCDGSIDEDGACWGCTQAEYGGHTYQFCDDGGYRWTWARDACWDYDYYLVTINDAGEDAFLVAEAVAGGWGGLWIGYNDRGGGNEGNWTWVEGNGSGYENWNPGEPNNSGNEDCGEMAPWSGWLWNDIGCSTQQAWICELDE